MAPRGVTPQQVPGVALSTCPALTSISDRLYVMYADGSGKLNYVSTTDGESWSKPEQVPLTLTQNPAVSIFVGMDAKERLCAAVQGAAVAGQLWFVTSASQT